MDRVLARNLWVFVPWISISSIPNHFAGRADSFCGSPMSPLVTPATTGTFAQACLHGFLSIHHNGTCQTVTDFRKDHDVWPWERRWACRSDLFLRDISPREWQKAGRQKAGGRSWELCGFDSSQLSCDTRQARHRKMGLLSRWVRALIIKFWNWEEYFQQTCPNSRVSTDPL